MILLPALKSRNECCAARKAGILRYYTQHWPALVLYHRTAYDHWHGTWRAIHLPPTAQKPFPSAILYSQSMRHESGSTGMLRQSPITFRPSRRHGLWCMGSTTPLYSRTVLSLRRSSTNPTATLSKNLSADNTISFLSVVLSRQVRILPNPQSSSA